MQFLSYSSWQFDDWHLAKPGRAQAQTGVPAIQNSQLVLFRCLGDVLDAASGVRRTVGKRERREIQHLRCSREQSTITSRILQYRLYCTAVQEKKKDTVTSGSHHGVGLLSTGVPWTGKLP